jgi:hypothetical protein
MAGCCWANTQVLWMRRRPCFVIRMECTLIDWVHSSKEQQQSGVDGAEEGAQHHDGSINV